MRSANDYSSEFLIGAEDVLRRRRRPMRPIDIWNYGSNKGLFSDKLAGKTPWQTLKSKLSVHIRKYGPNSVFVRTSPGRFYLRDLLGDPWELYDAEPWLPPSSSERVIVFPSSILDSLGRFQGLIHASTEVLDTVLCSESLGSMDRRKAELDNLHAAARHGY